MKPPQDRLPPRKPLGTVRGDTPERLSEYFDFERWPEKATLKVTRNELLAIITRLERARRSLPWYSRLWRNLMRRPGDPPAEAVPDARHE